MTPGSLHDIRSGKVQAGHRAQTGDFLGASMVSQNFEKRLLDRFFPNPSLEGFLAQGAQPLGERHPRRVLLVRGQPRDATRREDHDAQNEDESAHRRILQPLAEGRALSDG